MLQQTAKSSDKRLEKASDLLLNKNLQTIFWTFMLILAKLCVLTAAVAGVKLIDS